MLLGMYNASSGRAGVDRSIGMGSWCVASRCDLNLDTLRVACASPAISFSLSHLSPPSFSLSLALSNAFLGRNDEVRNLRFSGMFIKPMETCGPDDATGLFFVRNLSKTNQNGKGARSVAH